jgi:uncharacterized protein YbjT (DUF2867 family)
MRRVAVIGATGYVGGRLLDRLLASADFEIVALARTPEKLSRLAASSSGRLTVERADVQDLNSLIAALEGVESAFYLVHSLGAGSNFGDADRVGAENFAAACERAGVERIVYLSGLGAEGDADLSEHLSSRHATGTALRGGSVPLTELRAAIVVGSGSASFEIVRDLSRKLPVMVAPRWVRSRCEPIGIRDVISYLVGVLDEPRADGQTLDIGCGEVLSYEAMMKICAEEQGKRCWVITVPVLTPRLSSYWLHLVTSVDMRIARPLIDGLRNDVVTTDQRIRDWIDVELADYRTSVRRALARERARTKRESRWTDALPQRVRDAAPRGGIRVRPSLKSFRDSRAFETNLSPQELYRRISRVGGAFGYGRTAGGLWRIRGLIDRLGGGPGLRRGRPFGEDLHNGDVVDFWRVVDAAEPERLELVAEMRVPGEARLEWRIEPTDGGARLVQTATLTNESLLSGLYWYSIAPAHNWVFNRMARHLLSA